jgi:NifU-like protein
MWNYTDKVMDHFLNPRNVGEVKDPDGSATVGNISCGDALKLTFKLDKDGKIEDAKFQTFGCGSAIASSSVLTEMIKGLTIEEAKKITNQEIVDVLGGLPEAKIHCSVMGMEALQAAIADFRGEKYEEDSETDREGNIVCHCFGVTDVKIRRIAKENNLHTVGDITHYSKAGGACGKCKDEIKEILDGIWNVKRKEVETTELPIVMTFAQKVMKVQDIIDNDIRPMLERDGGSIELVDLRENTVIVRLKGRCAVCPNSKITIRNTVETRLKECISKDLTVEEVK